MCTETVVLIQLMLNLQEIKTSLNLSSKHKYKQMNILSLYYDLYGLNKLCPPDTYVDIFP